MKEYRWAVIGCGVIAKEMAESMNKLGRSFYGVWNRTFEKAEAFAKEYQIPHVYKNVRELIEDTSIDIIYIATPHNLHYPFLIKALNAGRHVLCEKAITLNSEELKEAVMLSRKQNVILAEAMTLYHLPLYKKLHQLLQEQTLGSLRFIQMNFGSYKDYDMGNRFFCRELAGGALLDIGVYALSFIRWFLSAAPDQITSQVKLAPTGVDEQAGILLTNPAGEMASVSMTLHAKQPKRGMAAFDKGYLEIYNYPRACQAVITYTQDGHQEVIDLGNSEDSLIYEIQDMETAVSGGENLMHLDYTTDVMDIMTKLRKDWGIVYPEEE